MRLTHIQGSVSHILAQDSLFTTLTEIHCLSCLASWDYWNAIFHDTASKNKRSSVTPGGGGCGGGRLTQHTEWVQGHWTLTKYSWVTLVVVLHRTWSCEALLTRYKKTKSESLLCEYITELYSPGNTITSRWICFIKAISRGKRVNGRDGVSEWLTGYIKGEMCTSQKTHQQKIKE